MNFKVKQVRTPPLRVGKERKPLGRRAAINIAAEGRTQGPLGGRGGDRVHGRRQNEAFTRAEERWGVLPWTEAKERFRSS